MSGWHPAALCPMPQKVFIGPRGGLPVAAYIYSHGRFQRQTEHFLTLHGLGCTVLKPVPGSGSRAKCAQFRGSSYAKHVSSWFQPWATLWPTCHMLVPASLLQSVECSTECKNSIFHCTIGCNKYKSSLASGASPQTPPGGLFLPPGPPPPAWVHAAHRHGMVFPRKVWFQRPCSSLVLVPEEVVEPASGRYGWRVEVVRVYVLYSSEHFSSSLPITI